jgi:hypothetical protein
MNTWIVSTELGGAKTAPRRVYLNGNGGAAVLLSLADPASGAVMGEGLWSLSGPGISGSALFRTVSAKRAKTAGVMVLRGVRVVDEGRAMENKTIRLIRDLLDLDVMHASFSDSGNPAGCLSEKTEQVCRAGKSLYGNHNGSCA